MDRLGSLRNRETLLENDKLSPIEASRVNLRMVSIFLRIFQSFHSKLLGIFCFLFVINRQIIYNPIGFGLENWANSICFTSAERDVKRDRYIYRSL